MFKMHIAEIKLHFLIPRQNIKFRGAATSSQKHVSKCTFGNIPFKN